MTTDNPVDLAPVTEASAIEDSALITIPPETDGSLPEHSPKRVGKAKKVFKKTFRVLAIIVSSLLSVILALLLTVGILLGAFSAQMSGEAVGNAVQATDFYGIFAKMSVDDELSLLYARAVSAISSESTDYYPTLKEFLSSREFKNFVSDSVDRVVGSFGEDGISLMLSTDDVISAAGFLKGPIEQHFGYTVTDSDMDIIAYVLDAIGIGGKLLTIPMGEAMGIIYALRMLMSDTLRYTVYSLCILIAIIIILLNIKHYRTGALMCAVPLILVCVTWAGFSLAATAALMALNFKLEVFIYPILAYTAPPRDYLADTSLLFFIIAVIMLAVPYIISKVKRRISGFAA